LGTTISSRFVVTVPGVFRDFGRTRCSAHGRTLCEARRQTSSLQRRLRATLDIGIQSASTAPEYSTARARGGPVVVWRAARILGRARFQALGAPLDAVKAGRGGRVPRSNDVRGCRPGTGHPRGGSRPTHRAKRRAIAIESITPGRSPPQISDRGAGSTIQVRWAGTGHGSRLAYAYRQPSGARSGWEVVVVRTRDGFRRPWAICLTPGWRGGKGAGGAPGWDTMDTSHGKPRLYSDPLKLSPALRRWRAGPKTTACGGVSSNRIPWAFRLPNRPRTGLRDQAQARPWRSIQLGDRATARRMNMKQTRSSMHTPAALRGHGGTGSQALVRRAAWGGGGEGTSSRLMSARSALEGN